MVIDTEHDVEHDTSASARHITSLCSSMTPPSASAWIRCDQPRRRSGVLGGPAELHHHPEVDFGAIGAATARRLGPLAGPPRRAPSATGSPMMCCARSSVSTILMGPVNIVAAPGFCVRWGRRWRRYRATAFSHPASIVVRADSHPACSAAETAPSANMAGIAGSTSARRRQQSPCPRAPQAARTTGTAAAWSPSAATGRLAEQRLHLRALLLSCFSDPSAARRSAITCGSSRP